MIDFLETDERSKASSVFTAVGGGSGASWHALVADTDAADADAADADAVGDAWTVGVRSGAPEGERLARASGGVGRARAGGRREATTCGVRYAPTWVRVSRRSSGKEGHRAEGGLRLPPATCARVTALRSELN